MGDASDFRQTSLADLNSKYGLQGTNKIPKNATMTQIHELELKLSLQRAKSLATAGEIGARRDSAVAVQPAACDLIPARSTLSGEAFSSTLFEP